jgi:hypothetical protein
LQIPPSLNSKAILQPVRLLFLLRQNFYRRQHFPMRQVFTSAKDFGCAKFLASAKDFGCAMFMASLQNTSPSLKLPEFYCVVFFSGDLLVCYKNTQPIVECQPWRTTMSERDNERPNNGHKGGNAASASDRKVSGLCRFHWKWGEDAYSCAKPCSWQ